MSAEPKQPPSRFLVLLTVAGVVIVWLAIGTAPWFLLKDPEVASRFGDSFGFVNALFSALALAAVFWAIRLQSQELELQRQELADTRRELARSADAQQESHHALQQQVEALSTAARLNALAILNASIQTQLSAPNLSLTSQAKLAARSNAYIEEVESLLSRTPLPKASGGPLQ